MNLLTKKEYFKGSDSQVEYECQYYLNGSEEVLHGTETFWYETGVIEGQSRYQDGILDGISRWNYPSSGKRMWEVAYRTGKVLSGEFFDHNGLLISSIKDGNGYWIEFAPTERRVVYHAEYADGFLHGDEKNFDENGEIYSHRRWCEGTLLENDDDPTK